MLASLAFVSQTLIRMPKASTHPIIQIPENRNQRPDRKPIPKYNIEKIDIREKTNIADLIYVDVQRFLSINKALSLDRCYAVFLTGQYNLDIFSC